MAVRPLADAVENLLKQFDSRLAPSAEELSNELRRLLAQERERAAVRPAAEEFGANYVAATWPPRQPSKPRLLPPSPRAMRAARVPLLTTSAPATPRWVGEPTPMTQADVEPVQPAWPELSGPASKMHGDPLWTSLQNLRQGQARTPSPPSRFLQQRWPDQEQVYNFSSPPSRFLQQRWPDQEQARAPSPPSPPSQQQWPDQEQARAPSPPSQQRWPDQEQARAPSPPSPPSQQQWPDQEQARAPSPPSPPSQQQWPDTEEVFKEESSRGSVLLAYTAGTAWFFIESSSDSVLPVYIAGTAEGERKEAAKRKEAAERKKAAAQAKGKEAAEREEGAERK